MEGVRDDAGNRGGVDPAAAIAPFAASLADRYPRERVLLAGHVVQAPAYAATPRGRLAGLALKGAFEDARPRDPDGRWRRSAALLLARGHAILATDEIPVRLDPKRIHVFDRVTERRLNRRAA
mgnify:CR=1 FL=1